MKRKDSVYAFMRSRGWLKVRTSAGRVTMQKRIENWGPEKTLIGRHRFALAICSTRNTILSLPSDVTFWSIPSSSLRLQTHPRRIQELI
jgi:hypothetical protein